MRRRTSSRSRFICRYRFSRRGFALGLGKTDGLGRPFFLGTVVPAEPPDLVIPAEAGIHSSPPLRRKPPRSSSLRRPDPFPRRHSRESGNPFSRHHCGESPHARHPGGGRDPFCFCLALVFGAVAKTDSRPCAFRPPSWRPSYFLLLVQE